jgi:PGF-pre-PGF domain-containing protein
MKVTNANFAVSEIDFKVNSAVSTMKLALEKLSSKPATVPDTGKVFQYLSITKTGLADNQLSGTATIKYSVTKLWLAANGVTPESVVLKRFVNGAWVELTTRLLSQDTVNAYYSSDSPGFSYFAIGVKSTPAVVTPPVSVTPPVTTPTVTPTPPVEPTQPAPVVAPAATNKTPPAAPTATSKKPSALLTSLIVIVLLLAVVFIIVNATKKKKPKYIHEQ